MQFAGIACPFYFGMVKRDVLFWWFWPKQNILGNISFEIGDFLPVFTGQIKAQASLTFASVFFLQLECAYDQIIVPLENFRKEKIGKVKEGKKKFEKQTAKFCQSQERYLNLSLKKQDSQLKEVSHVNLC